MAHASCNLCDSWLPSQGVPEAQCVGCEVFNCSPYDSEGVCPEGEVHTKVDSRHCTIPALSAALRGAGLNMTEVERISNYMLDNNICESFEWRSMAP